MNSAAVPRLRWPSASAPSRGMHALMPHVSITGPQCSPRTLNTYCVASPAVVQQAQTVPQAVAPSVVAQAATQYELDVRTGLQRLKFDRKGWNFWNWTDAETGKTHRIHYVQAGDKGPVVVLVHGYGASAYHWRYNIPALAQNHRVFAIDMLGFGWSEKALVDYSSGGIWSRQISAFVSEVAGGGPAVLVGNSLGGFASMATAARSPELIRGVVVLNGAGPFEETERKVTVSADVKPPWYEPFTTQASSLMKRGAMHMAFMQARQPERIKQVLRMVYTHPSQLDADLVESIEQPARDPQASEVFYRVNDQRGASVTINSLLRKFEAAKMPLLLLWGDLDPWMVPMRAARIQSLYPAAQKISLQSGHCPHDDSPAEANAALLKWLEQLPPAESGKVAK